MSQSPAVAVPTLAAQRRQIIRNDQLSARADLNGQQTALELGQAIPLVIGKRTGSTGGVLLSPPAAECRFTNDEANRVTASYLLVLADGQLGTIAHTDAYQGDTQLASGELTQAYGARAASWAPGNFIQQRFEVTISSRREIVEGKAIGEGQFLDLSGFSDEELALHIDEQVASLSIKSSGNYITEFQIDVQKRIEWPTVGQIKAYKGEFMSPSFSASAGESGGPSVIYNPFVPTVELFEGLTWNAASDPLSGPSAANYAQSPGIFGYGTGQIWWAASNQWLYDRTNAGRYLATTQYNVTRPASTEPYGDIDFNLTETINGGYLQRVTASLLLQGGTYYATIYGGFPAVTYDVTITEENSEPLPRPEATLYCGTGGSYAGLTTVSVVKTYPAGDTGWQRQAHFFIRNGQPIYRLIEGSSGATNLFPDVAHHLLTVSGQVPAQLIDTPALTAAARFCQINGITFDGVIANPSNVREYLHLMAPMHLLRVTDRWGKLGLRPALPVTPSHTIDTAPLTPVMSFTEASIHPDTFKISRRSKADRRRFCALVLWRDQPDNDLGVTQATEVRYSGTAIDGPFEDMDGSEYMTRELHAVRAGALRLAQRRHITHDASWGVTPTAAIAALRAGDLVRVDLARNPSVGSAGVWSYLYEIEGISGPVTGPWTISASHHPVDDDGRSLLALEVAAATVA
jgi:hypothetical protein